MTCTLWWSEEYSVQVTRACIQQLPHIRPPWNNVPGLGTKCWAGQTHSSLAVLGITPLLLMLCPVIQTPAIFFIVFLISVQNNGFFFSGIFIHLVSADPCSRVPSPNLVPSCQSPSSSSTSASFCFLVTWILLSYFFWIPSFIFSPSQIAFMTSFFNLWALLWPLPTYTHLA